MVRPTALRLLIRALLVTLVAAAILVGPWTDQAGTGAFSRQPAARVPGR